MRLDFVLPYSVRLATLLIAMLVLSACGSQESDSTLSDIFENDTATRHAATAAEKAWTVKLPGCTGSMLTTKYLLTANHCQPASGQRYTSGAALAAGRTAADMEVVRIAERHSGLDYSIVEVKWLSGAATAGQKYTPSVSIRADDLTFGVDRVATKLFTVGFPADQRIWGATYAEGYAKEYSDTAMKYNIGSINGNSGGAVWRSSDQMLVGQTNFGTHQFGEQGWNHNNPEDRNAWNGGSAMYKVFTQSTLLKSLFPNGKNSSVTESGDPIVL